MKGRDRKWELARIDWTWEGQKEGLVIRDWSHELDHELDHELVVKLLHSLACSSELWHRIATSECKLTKQAQLLLQSSEFDGEGMIFPDFLLRIQFW